jgi:peptidoglycan/LPS O-acetylase OafA/YrhL
MDLSNFYVACAWSAFCFVAIVPFCWLSFAFFEKPIMDRFRVRYVKQSPSGSDSAAPGTLQAPAVSPIT